MSFNELIVGDSVYVYLYRYKTYYKGRVVKETKSTVQVEIVVRGQPLKYTFNSTTGYERGANNYYINCNRLEFISDEKAEKHNKAQIEENNRDYIIRVTTSRLDWKSLSTEDLYKIYDIIKPTYERQKNGI